MNRTNIFTMMAAALALGSLNECTKLDTDFRANRKRGKKGSGRGGYHPPRHERARRWKKAFGGLATPGLRGSAFELK